MQFHFYISLNGMLFLKTFQNYRMESQTHLIFYHLFWITRVRTLWQKKKKRFTRPPCTELPVTPPVGRRPSSLPPSPLPKTSSSRTASPPFDLLKPGFWKAHASILLRFSYMTVKCFLFVLIIPLGFPYSYIPRYPSQCPVLGIP